MTKAAARKIEKSVEAYRSIGEAAEELDLQPHVLRYWEGKFARFVKPLKRRDGRRMFRQSDMEALRAIQMLVHGQGMTLKGAEKMLGEQGVEAVLGGLATILSPVQAQSAAVPTASPARELQDNVRRAFAPADAAPVEGGASVERLEAVLMDLTDIKRRLDAARLKKAA